MQRQLPTLERLLEITSTDLETALSAATDLIAESMSADKVDAFLYEHRRDSLSAIGSSHQPLSAIQREHGLDFFQISNGGRAVQVFQTGKPFMTGRLDEDAEELRGVKELLKIRSAIALPLAVERETRGVLLIASQKPDLWTENDLRYATAVARWVGNLIQRAELVQEIARNAAEQGRMAAADELVIVLAHDFRNHLSPIHVRLGIVERSLRAAGRMDDAKHVEQSLKGLDRLAALVGDILDVSRLDRGMLHLDPQPVDMVALLQECAANLQTPEQPIEVKVRAQSRLVVSGDPARLRQLVENVFANARKHSPRNAPVVVHVTEFLAEDGPRLRVDIVDQGPGVAPEVLPRIFDRFVSGEPQHGGLGLGLYLAHRIASLHYGELTVENLAGRGARFVLTLPCAGCAGVAEAEEQPATH